MTQKPTNDGPGRTRIVLVDDHPVVRAGLRAMIDAGADTIGDPSQSHCVAIDARAPLYDGGICTRVDCVSLGIMVNRDAQRFYDEGEDFWPKRYAIWGRLVAQQPGQIGYSIIDAKAVGRFMPPVFRGAKAEEVYRRPDSPGLCNSRCIGGRFDAQRQVMMGDRAPHFLRLALHAGVDAAHGALQLGQLAHHVGGEVGLGEPPGLPGRRHRVRDGQHLGRVLPLAVVL